MKAFLEALAEDPEPIVAFYGGEPLLNPEFIEEVMDEARQARFVVQTNATLIEALPAKYWRRFDAALLSIDGRREVTDAYRGRGVYDKVLRAARLLRSMGFKGDLVARMTLSKLSDVYLDVVHLLELGLFDHVHWQLDVVWSPRWPGFEEWCRRYVHGISRLVEFWAEELESGRLHGVAPILGVLKPFLTGEPLEPPPCGAGRSAVAVSTDGRVLACPIAVEEGWATLGWVWDPSWRRSLGKLSIGEPCISCSYYAWCGGRCLYAYVEQLWGLEGFRQVCRLTTWLIDEVRRALPVVNEALSRGLVALDALLYPNFNNTVEVIP